jgi:hypothetical protein
VLGGVTADDGGDGLGAARPRPAHDGVMTASRSPVPYESAKDQFFRGVNIGM